MLHAASKGTLVTCVELGYVIHYNHAAETFFSKALAVKTLDDAVAPICAGTPLGLNDCKDTIYNIVG